MTITCTFRPQSRHYTDSSIPSSSRKRSAERIYMNNLYYKAKITVPYKSFVSASRLCVFIHLKGSSIIQRYICRRFWKVIPDNLYLKRNVKVYKNNSVSVPWSAPTGRLQLFNIDANNFTMIFSHKWPLHVSDIYMSISGVLIYRLFHCRMWCYAIGVEAVVLRSWCVVLCTVCQLVSN